MRAAGEDKFSPLAWGWSAMMIPAPCDRVVFPTRVGMVRRIGLGAMNTRSFPHSRGDGPHLLFSLSFQFQFSPLAWGWSGKCLNTLERLKVFPTRVGMVRRSSPSAILWACFPHSRGDGPRCMNLKTILEMFSPLAWGWSRSESDGEAKTMCFPHSRGDGPLDVVTHKKVKRFSPLAWGWSVIKQTLESTT